MSVSASKRYQRFLRLVIKARKEAGISQQELANMLNKPQSFISEYELGKKSLNVQEFAAITRNLKISADALINR